MSQRVTNYCDVCRKNTLHVSADLLGIGQQPVETARGRWLYCKGCGSPNVPLRNGPEQPLVEPA